MAKHLPQIQLAQSLQSLIDACETMCVAECCGIHAYDFSPLHIASHLSTWTGRISEKDVTELEKEINCLSATAARLAPDKDGFICSIAAMNQHFSKNELESLAQTLRQHLALARRVFEYSEKLRDEAETDC